MVRYNPVDQAKAISLIGRDRLACEQQFHGSGFAHKPRQTLCASPAWHKAKSNLRLPTLRFLRSNPNITRHRKFIASSKTNTVNSGNYYFRHTFDSRKNLLSLSDYIMNLIN